MYQNMSHSFYVIPAYFVVLLPIFLSQHINGFANNLHMFDISVEYDGISSDFFKAMTTLVCNQNINRCKYVFKPFLVSNFLSHKSISCRD